MTEVFWKADLNSMTPQFMTSGSSPGSTVARTTAPQFVFEGEAGLLMTTASGKPWQRASAGK